MLNFAGYHKKHNLKKLLFCKSIFSPNPNLHLIRVGQATSDKNPTLVLALRLATIY